MQKLDIDLLDFYVPSEERASQSMLDSDEFSLSQSNIFESLDVTNPLLVARKRFE